MKQYTILKFVYMNVLQVGLMMIFIPVINSKHLQMLISHWYFLYLIAIDAISDVYKECRYGEKDIQN